MAKSNSIPTTRRSLMAGGLAAAVVPIAVPAIAAGSQPDPIYAAIEAHRRMHQAFTNALRVSDDADNKNPTLEKAVREASDAEDGAAIELLNVTPTTIVGVIVLLRYAHDFEAAGNWWPGNIETGDEPEPHIDDSHKWHVLLFQHAASALENVA